jgi:hypothetical protein
VVILVPKRLCGQKKRFFSRPVRQAQGGQKNSYFLAVILLIFVCEYVKIQACLPEGKRNPPEGGEKQTFQIAYL